MSQFTTKDDVTICFKDWAKGQPIVFCHGWPLSSDAWEDQMMFFAGKGFRVVAHDRRCHGRSEQTADGNNMDTYANDLAQLIESLDLENIILVGHSTGGGEAARYVGLHGTDRVAAVVLVSAVTPGMLQSENNPEGVPKSVFDQIRDGVEKDRAQYFKEFSIPFFGANRERSTVSQGVRDNFWRMCMQGGLKPEYDCIEAFSETDFSEDLEKFDVPTLIVHGDDDQIVPYACTALRAKEMVPQAELLTYEGAPHGLPVTMKQRLNEDLLGFVQRLASRVPMGARRPSTTGATARRDESRNRPKTRPEFHQ